MIVKSIHTNAGVHNCFLLDNRFKISEVLKRQRKTSVNVFLYVTVQISLYGINAQQDKSIKSRLEKEKEFLFGRNDYAKANRLRPDCYSFSARAKALIFHNCLARSWQSTPLPLLAHLAAQNNCERGYYEIVNSFPYPATISLHTTFSARRMLFSFRLCRSRGPCGCSSPARR